MKLPPRKYPRENCLGIFFSMKIPTMSVQHEKTFLMETPPVILTLQRMKKTDYL